MRSVCLSQLAAACREQSTCIIATFAPPPPPPRPLAPALPPTHLPHPLPPSPALNRRRQRGRRRHHTLTCTRTRTHCTHTTLTITHHPAASSRPRGRDEAAGVRGGAPGQERHGPPTPRARRVTSDPPPTLRTRSYTWLRKGGERRSGRGLHGPPCCPAAAPAPAPSGSGPVFVGGVKGAASAATSGR